MSEVEMDIESESDEENEIQDLEQLNAVLINDEPCSSTSVSKISISTSICSFSSQYEEYSKIEAVLNLNKMCDEKWRRLERILQSRLRECRQRLRDIQGTDNVLNDKGDKVETFRYVHCGKPYFKDKANFPAPDNDDTILMAKSEMYDFSNVVSVPGWTVKDKSQFNTLILKLSQEKRKADINSEIAALKRESKVNGKNNDKKIAKLTKEYDKVNKMSLKEVALPIDEEYDWDLIENKLNYRHTAQEFRSLWKLFLHPSINKSIWSRSEHMALQKIAYDENLQNWDKIAKDLNTGRTNYQCFVYFRTNMINTFTGRKWTKEEEEYLKRLIEYYKEDNYIPWGKVASSMENRTKIQVYNKYFRICEQRKGRFLAEEDAVILTCCDNFGPNFKKMTKYLPGRSLTQCRVRYQVLAKRRISTVWTIEEDRKLVQLMANQDSITNYSSIAAYLPGKDRVHIRARYVTLSKWMRRNPNVDIAKAPRRGARRLGHGHSADDLNRAIESLKNRIQSQVIDKKSKKLTENSPENVIEDAIVAHLVTENVKMEEARRIQVEHEEASASDNLEILRSKNCNVTNLRKILILLRAKLNKGKFLKSSYGEKYKGLLEPDSDTKTLKVKSYSKQNSETNIVMKETPDIWGNVYLGPLSYVLPPHYSSITGCKRLMSYVCTKQESVDINLNVVIRKNALLKDQAFLLMERFNSLFLWPLLLSNSHPETSGAVNELAHNYPENYTLFDNEHHTSSMVIRELAKDDVPEQDP